MSTFMSYKLLGNIPVNLFKLCSEILSSSIRFINSIRLPIIIIGNAQMPFKNSKKNLCFTLDCHLTMNAHVSTIAILLP